MTKAAVRPEEKQPVDTNPPVETADAPAAPEPKDAVYVVEKKAPPYVAGRRVKAGQELTLTSDQARHDLMAGHIWPKGVPRQSKPAATDAKAGNDTSNDA